MKRKVKENIDKAIGKKQIFTREDRKAIYSKIEQEGEYTHKTKARRRNKFSIISAYSLAATLLFLFGWYGIQEYSVDEADSAQQNQLYQSTSTGGGENTGKLNSETFPFTGSAEEDLAKQFPEKFNIVKKMYFSLNYIDNAQGKFVWGHPQNGDIQRVQFHVNYEKRMDLTTQETIEDGSVIETIIVLKKEGDKVSLLPKKEIYARSPLRYKSKVYLSGGHSFVTNSEWVMLIRNNYSNWTYKEGTRFGIPVYQIEGVDHQARLFTMTVAKETGALLELKMYNKENKVDFFITVQDIEINKGIENESEIFQLDLSGIKELSWDDFNSRTAGAQAFEGEKTGGVDTSGD